MKEWLAHHDVNLVCGMKLKPYKIGGSHPYKTEANQGELWHPMTCLARLRIDVRAFRNYLSTVAMAVKRIKDDSGL
jgi:hypothetical protein